MNMNSNRKHKDEEAMSYDNELDQYGDENRDDDFRYSNYEDNKRDLTPSQPTKPIYIETRLPSYMFDPNR